MSDKKRIYMPINQQSQSLLQPELQSDLLFIRPMVEGDFDALYAVASDPLIWQQHPAKNRYQKEEFSQYFNEAIASKGALVAINKVSNKVIGSSRYHDYSAENAELEIGWTFLARSHWGGRYNKDMKRLMLEHAFSFVQSVLFVVGAQNMRSRYAVMKIGGVEIEKRAGADCVENVVFQITKASFKV